jgi:hypothetical protein
MDLKYYINIYKMNNNINLDRQLFNSNTYNNKTQYNTRQMNQNNDLDKYFTLQSNDKCVKIDERKNFHMQINNNRNDKKSETRSVGFFDRNLIFDNRTLNVNYDLPVDTNIKYGKDKEKK